MSHSIEQIKDRIRKLLAVAENHASTEGEIANAMRFADLLMRRHNLDRKDIEAKDDGTFNIDSVDYDKRSVTLVGSRRTYWEMALANLVCSFVGTIKFYSNSFQYRKEPDGGPIDSDLHGPLVGTVFIFYGPKDDVRLACELFRDMGLRIAHFGKSKFGGYARGRGGSYCQGFVAGLKLANKRVERDALEDQSSSPGERALILANRQLTTQLRDRAIGWLKEEAGINLVKGGGLSGSSKNNQAYAHGVQDGRQTKMSKNRPERIV